MTSHSDDPGLLRRADIKLNFQQTMMDVDWMKIHEKAIKAALPVQWTPIDEINFTAIGFRLKVLGIEWDSLAELNSVLFFLEAIGIIEREWRKIRGNPISIFVVH